jgi:hypothetical protein
MAYGIYSKFHLLIYVTLVRDQYSRKSELSNNFCYKSLISNFSEICGKVYGIQGEVHLLPHVNWVVLCLKI